METALLNNELKLTCPEGFREMSKEELSGYNFYSEAPGWCVNDADRHIMVSVSWKQVPGLFAKMLKVKDVAKSMEGQMAQAMKAFQYKLVEFTARTPGGKEAEGFRYDYTVQDTGMSGESVFALNYFAECDIKDLFAVKASENIINELKRFTTDYLSVQFDKEYNALATLDALNK